MTSREHLSTETPGELPRRVRAARAYAGLSVVQLANSLGIGSKTIKRIEAGGRLVRPYELWGIAEICGVSREFFVQEALWRAAPGTDVLVLERLERIELALAALAKSIESTRCSCGRF